MGRRFLATFLIFACAVPARAQATPPANAPDSLSFSCDTVGCILHVGEGTQPPAVRFQVVDFTSGPSTDKTVVASADSGAVFPLVQVIARGEKGGSLVWQGKMPPAGDTIHIVVSILSRNRSWRRQIQLLSMPAAKRSLSLVPVGSRRFTWIVSRYVPDSITVELRDSVVAPTLKLCEQQRVVFQPLGDSGAHPDTVRARWLRGSVQQPSVCLAATRWKLTDAAGDQILSAVLVGGLTSILSDGTATTPNVDYSAVAEEPAHVVVGLAAITGSVALKDSAQQHDTSSDGRRKRAHVQPIIGVDFPLVFWSRPNVFQDVLSRVRVVTATFFSDPGFDLYVGAEVMPALRVSSQDLDVQLSLGHRFALGNARRGSFAVLLTFNASTILGSVLTGFGIGSK